MKPRQKRLTTRPMPDEVAKRTAQMVRDNVSIVPITGCWVWMRTSTTRGYGLVTFLPWRSDDGWKQQIDDGYLGFGMRYRPKQAHRLSLSAARGVFLMGGDVDHLCEHPWCVNPDHLEHVTQKENLQRSIQHRRSKANPSLKSKHRHF